MGDKTKEFTPKNYNLMTPSERRECREAYVLHQGGKCYYCGESLSIRPVQNLPLDWDKFPPNFLKYPVRLHHSHDTGMTIGAVHSYCNAVLWLYHGE